MRLDDPNSARFPMRIFAFLFATLAASSTSLSLAVVALLAFGALLLVP